MGHAASEGPQPGQALVYVQPGQALVYVQHVVGLALAHQTWAGVGVGGHRHSTSVCLEACTICCSTYNSIEHTQLLNVAKQPHLHVSE